MITESEILNLIKAPCWGLPPLTVQSIAPPFGQAKSSPDAIITLGWQGRTYLFAAEVSSLWTPKAVVQARDQIKRTARDLKSSANTPLWPMVILPYLNEDQLRVLEADGVSGIDLCGNGTVVVPGKLCVFRSGAPNKYRWEGRIKNVYRGASAIVARVFLLMPEFASVGDVLNKISSLGGNVTLPTVSKVCKNLEQDLVIEQTPGINARTRRLRLLQPEKLLDLLRDNYVPPKITRTVTGKYIGPPAMLTERLLDGETDTRTVVLNGVSSIQAYAIMARESMQTFYCTNVAKLEKKLGEDFTETERFANVRFQETQEEFVYFDRRPNLMVSPLQAYLELTTGDKREKETAEQVRRLILTQLLKTNDTR